MLGCERPWCGFLQVQLWSHPSIGALLSLMSNKQPASRLSSAISFVRKVAFRADTSLIEPRWLTAVADVLHPCTDQAVLMKALRFFRAASKVPLAEHLPAWHSAVFRLVPLLVPTQQLPAASGGSRCSNASTASVAARSTVSEEALAVLLNLSEHAAFKNALYASGSLQPLLSLLSAPSKATRISAACILSQMSDVGLGREALCQEASLLTLLRALQSTACVEVSIGLLYVLNQLTAYKQTVKGVLRQCGTVPMLLKLLKRTCDEDALLGIVQLLELLGVASPAQSVGEAKGLLAGACGNGLTSACASDITVFVGNVCRV